MLILNLKWIIKIVPFEWPKISMSFDDQNDSVRKLIALFDVIIEINIMTSFLFSHFVASLIQLRTLINTLDVSSNEIIDMNPVIFIFCANSFSAPELALRLQYNHVVKMVFNQQWNFAGTSKFLNNSYHRISPWISALFWYWRDVSLSAHCFFQSKQKHYTFWKHKNDHTQNSDVIGPCIPHN